MQDREFKAFASTVSTYPDLYKFIKEEKKYTDDYWNCMIIALYNIYPPRPEPFPDELC
jgi:ABC-type maltose transport system permease subunit